MKLKLIAMGACLVASITAGCIIYSHNVPAAAITPVTTSVQANSSSASEAIKGDDPATSNILLQSVADPQSSQANDSAPTSSANALPAPAPIGTAKSSQVQTKDTVSANKANGNTGTPVSKCPQNPSKTGTSCPAQSNSNNSTAAVKTTSSSPSSKLVISEQAKTSFSEFQNKVVDLVNAERKANGLNPLTVNELVTKTATLKSEDMAKLDYFGHDSPTYGSAFDMMKQYGIHYMAAGENIAKGQSSPEQVMEAWMNSPGHRANILKPDFTQIGVGIAKNSEGQYIWTQQFIG